MLNEADYISEITTYFGKEAVIAYKEKGHHLPVEDFVRLVGYDTNDHTVTFRKHNGEEVEGILGKKIKRMDMYTGRGIVRFNGHTKNENSGDETVHIPKKLFKNNIEDLV